ncbi:hypothetical protein [Corynebacterium durum]|uniref:hypothetical protein n=1 Tax=Corynebacterium durum TaxID=61592 RepID=UPI0028F0359E|nr:hypothetical protein [Corynebacterium durum]
MKTPDSLVKAGKVCALGASEMYAYQLHNMEIVAQQNGWTPFASMQCHYNTAIIPLQPTRIWALGTSRMAFGFRAVEDG